MQFTFMKRYWRFYLQGFSLTIRLSVFAVFFGTFIGILIVLLRRSKMKPIKIIGDAYVGFIRGTPLLAQIYLVYIGIPAIFKGYDLPEFTVGVIALSLNAAAYISAPSYPPPAR